MQHPQKLSYLIAKNIDLKNYFANLPSFHKLRFLIYVFGKRNMIVDNILRYAMLC